jgi:hypothetical protein
LGETAQHQGLEEGPQDEEEELVAQEEADGMDGGAGI